MKRKNKIRMSPFCCLQGNNGCRHLLHQLTSQKQRQSDSMSLLLRGHTTKGTEQESDEAVGPSSQFARNAISSAIM